MNPYPLLLWLESNGGAVTGGADASYCEPSQEPAPDSSGTTSDLDTGDRTDARPSPIVEARDRRNSPEPERQGRTEEKSKETGATGDETKVNPAGSSEKDGEPEDERGESSTPGSNLAAPDGNLTSSPSSGAPVEDVNSRAEIRAKI